MSFPTGNSSLTCYRQYDDSIVKSGDWMRKLPDNFHIGRVEQGYMVFFGGES